MWIIVGQVPIKAGWWDASLALLIFRRSNKHCIHLSAKTIYFSYFLFAMSEFAPIKIFYSNTVCNKSVTEAWICLVSFYVRRWWTERLVPHVFFSELLSSLKYQGDIVFSVFFSSKFNENWNRVIHLITSFLIILKHLFIIYVIDLSTKNNM